MRREALLPREEGCLPQSTDTLGHVPSFPRRAIGAACPLPTPATSQTWSALRQAFTFPQGASVVFLVFAAFVTATCSKHGSKPIDVSVRDVIIDPYAVDGKRVRLIGVLHRTKDDDALYWHEQDIQHSNRKHGVALRLSSSSTDRAVLPGTYVAIEGIFEADDDRSGSEFNGALREDTEVR